MIGELAPFCLDRVGKKHSAYKSANPNLDALPKFGYAACIWMYVAVRYDLATAYQFLLPSVTLRFAVIMYALTWSIIITEISHI